MSDRADDGRGPDAELVALRSDPELARLFFSETLDHLGSIEASVLALEGTPDDTATIDGIFRPFHSLKANAAALGIPSIEVVAHRVESLLDRARSGTRRLAETEGELILAAVDLLMAMVRDVERRLNGRDGEDFHARCKALLMALDRADATDQPALAAARDGRHEASGFGGSAAAESGAKAGTVKVDTRKLDGLVDLVGELAIVQSMIQQDPHLQGTLSERLHRNLTQLRRITGELQRGSIAMRLVPIRRTFQRMSRLVHDVANKSGKPIDLTITGEDIELDRNMVEEISDPLMHMLRNSIDHGIEDADTRERCGKPSRGQLSLRAFHQAGTVVIAVGDDGRGLDTAKLHRKAIEKKLLGVEATPSESELHALVFQAGFSTADEVTEMSGRGIGMDVVRRNVERLRGRIEIRTQDGIGTTFSIKLPLTLATVEGLTLSVGAQRFVLPAFAVRESLRPAADHVHVVPGHGFRIQVRDELIPLVRLADLFNIPGGVTEPDHGVAVILEDPSHRLAILVDHLLGKQEIVIKSLGEAMTNIQGVSGGAILADGCISLILDAGGLMQLERGQATWAA